MQLYAALHLHGDKVSISEMLTQEISAGIFDEVCFLEGLLPIIFSSEGPLQGTEWMHVVK